MTALNDTQQQYADFKARQLSLNMERGQPADANFDLSLPLLDAVGRNDIKTDNGVDIRNYPGGIAGLAEARALFAQQIGVEADEIIMGNNSSLEVMSHVLTWALLKGVLGSQSPWYSNHPEHAPQLLVTTPGYDRHFSLAASLGYELVSVEMTPDGPDMDAVERLAASSERIKGIYFVPNYSNPTGDCLSESAARRLMSMPTAASDFTVLADDAYAVHHLVEPDAPAPRLLRIAEEMGHPDRVIVFGSTSKVTFASAGLAFAGMSKANVAHWGALFSQQSIGPNKVEQWRHVKFLREYPNGIAGLMRDHASILKPKFDAVARILQEQLGNRDLATWTEPRGGYFVSLDTRRPIAARVVELAREAGVALTPVGATYPGGVDPHNRNIRLAPTRPELADVETATQVICCCIVLASAEFDQSRA